MPTLPPTARELGAGMLDRYPQNTGATGLEGSLLIPTTSWKTRGSGQAIHNHRASNHLPAHIRASWRVHACLAALPGFPSHTPGAVNYKSGFSTVSSS